MEVVLEPGPCERWRVARHVERQPTPMVVAAPMGRVRVSRFGGDCSPPAVEEVCVWGGGGASWAAGAPPRPWVTDRRASGTGWGGVGGKRWKAHSRRRKTARRGNEGRRSHALVTGRAIGRPLHIPCSPIHSSILKIINKARPGAMARAPSYDDASDTVQERRSNPF
jgi:hypothetical protein